MINQKIQQKIKNIEKNKNQTLEIYLSYNKKLDVNIKYKSFKPENKLLIITNLTTNNIQINPELKNRTQLISPEELKNKKSDLKQIKKLLKNRIIIVNPKELANLGFIINKIKKKPIYMEDNINDQIITNIYNKPLKIVKNTACFKVGKIKQIQIKDIIEKSQNINRQILELQPDIVLEQIKLRTTQTKLI